MEVIKVNENEIDELSAFATQIVRNHFDSIIGTAQNDYMLSKFQTVEAIAEQFVHGYRYYWAVQEGKKAGFLAFFPRDGKMYLSKFYVHKDFRGKRIASGMFEFLVEETKKQGLDSIFLNVNRDNTEVINIYYHLGFVKTREEKNDIGSGFYMDDYVLEYFIK